MRLKERILFILLSALLVTAHTQARPQSAQAEPVLEGLDPVMLVRGKEVQGEFDISVTRGQFQYLFANAENKAAFEKDPARYEIQLGGACARMGAPTGGNPHLFTVHKERIYIFGSAECKKLFEAAPEKYIESGMSAEPPPAPDALKKGRALIEKAVTAIGGAARLDALASYQEQRKAMQHRQTGDVEIKYLTAVVFPNRLRQEVIAPDYGQVIVIKPDESFGFAPRAARPARALPGIMRDEYERQITRNPLIILKNHKSANFKAVAAGTEKVGEMVVEQVAVEASGLKVKLGIDPATGRVVALSYQGRGPGGVIGQVTRIYSDFRAVDGLTLPFKVAGAFNGSSDPQASTTVESITVNGQIAPDWFEKPKTAGAQ
jgi:YHS domain-containing protein